MRIAITGSRGFIGRRLVARATAAGHEVIAMGNDTWLDPLRPDVVIHAGWHGAHADRYDEAVQMANVVQTALAVRRAAEAKAKLWIGIGSQAEIEAAHAYGRAKRAARDAAIAAGGQHGIDVTWARLFSVYGPHDPGPGLIHDLVEAIRGKEQIALSSCEQTWDFLYEDDAADAILALVGAPSNLYDVASGQHITVKAAVLAVQAMMHREGVPDHPIAFGKVPGHSMPRADLRMITRHTRWLPQVTLAAGLKRTIKEQP